MLFFQGATYDASSTGRFFRAKYTGAQAACNCFCSSSAPGGQTNQTNRSPEETKQTKQTCLGLQAWHLPDLQLMIDLLHLLLLHLVLLHQVLLLLPGRPQLLSKFQTTLVEDHSSYIIIMKTML